MAKKLLIVAAKRNPSATPLARMLIGTMFIGSNLLFGLAFLPEESDEWWEEGSNIWT